VTFFKLGLSLVRNEIRRNRFYLNSISKNACTLHLKLAQCISPELWRTLDSIAAIKSKNEYKRARIRKNSKLERLLDRKNNKQDTSTKKIVNLSSHVPDVAEMRVLEKGLNYTVSPTSIPVENIICCVEDSIQNLTDEEKYTFIQYCSIILRKARAPKSNISKEERESLKNLKNNENLFILKVDKGGATILMDQNDYKKKMIEHLLRPTATGNFPTTPLRRL
jgi:hypothetical protein